MSAHSPDGTAEMHPRAAELVATLRLEPHPEGGFFREVFRSSSIVSPDDARSPRRALTTIYFLLPQGSHSRWHQVDSDEVWHLYEGGPLELLEMDPRGSSLSRHVLDRVGGAGDGPVHTVIAGRWQAARPIGGGYALVGCTVGPGFEYADFRMLADDRALATTVRENLSEVAALI